MGLRLIVIAQRLEVVCHGNQIYLSWYKPPAEGAAGDISIPIIVGTLAVRP